MKVLALVSGGKDSCLNMMHCIANGHEIIALANTFMNETTVDLPDLQNIATRNRDQDPDYESYMYQTVGTEGIRDIAEAMGLPLFRRRIKGTAINKKLYYSPEKEDEIEDLYELVKEAKEKMPDIEAVASGAILSDYQRTRVENICSRLGLKSLAFLWHRPQIDLLKEMILYGIDAVIIKVAGIGLSSKHLGKSLSEMQEHLIKMNHKYDLHVCGEGGEYETFVRDCPLFKNKIEIYDPQIHCQTADVNLMTFSTRLVHKSLDNSYDMNNLRPALLDPFFEALKSRLRNPSENEVFRIAEQLTIAKMGENNVYDSEMYLEISNSKSLFCSHTLNIDIKNGSINSDKFKEKIRHLEKLLDSDGYQIQDAVQVFVVLSDISSFNELNSVYSEIFGYTLPPARVCFATEGLSKGNSIHIMIVFFKNHHIERTGLHVKSLSYWAPAIIGPYSQYSSSNGYHFISGTLGLNPTTSNIPSHIPTEVSLCLQNLRRVMMTIKSRKVVAGIAYITNRHLAPACITAWLQFLAHMEDQFDDLIIVEVDSMPKMANVEFQVFTEERVSKTKAEISFETQVADITALKRVIHLSQGLSSILIGFTTRLDLYENFGMRHNQFWIPVKSIWNILLQAKQFAEIFIREKIV